MNSISVGERRRERQRADLNMTPPVITVNGMKEKKMTERIEVPLRALPHSLALLPPCSMFPIALSAWIAPATQLALSKAWSDIVKDREQREYKSDQSDKGGGNI